MAPIYNYSSLSGSFSMPKLIFFLLQLISLSSWSQNPVGDDNPFMADPTIFYHKGVYYLYGTGGGNKDDGFKVFTSTDKQRWQDKGYVLKKGESFGTSGFWAPQVFEYKHKFYIAYTANEHIAIAVADSPLGPFTQQHLQTISNVRMIDPYVFFDNDKIYLYHVRLDAGNRIYVAEMNGQLTGINPATLKECISATEKWEDTQDVKWKVAEGPTVIKYKGWYYLIYSANDFRNTDYAVGYAVSRSPLGPWQKYSGNPILSKKHVGINGPGHGDVLMDKNGGMGYVFHTHYSGEKVAKRRTAYMGLQFVKNKNNAPRLIVLQNTFRFLQSIQ